MFRYSQTAFQTVSLSVFLRKIIHMLSVVHLVDMHVGSSSKFKLDDGRTLGKLKHYTGLLDQGMNLI